VERQQIDSDQAKAGAVEHEDHPAFHQRLLPTAANIPVFAHIADLTAFGIARSYNAGFNIFPKRARPDSRNESLVSVGAGRHHDGASDLNGRRCLAAVHRRGVWPRLANRGQYGKPADNKRRQPSHASSP
jgi:hypothetical protein